MSFRKYKDPERVNQNITEPIISQAPEPIDTSKLYKLTEEYRKKKLEETPRLEEFENMVRQYVNDYIVYQTKQFYMQGKSWNPTTDSVYFCYTRIKDQLMFNDDKEFREWYNKTNISEIRQIISNELSMYMVYRRARGGN